MSSLLAHSLFSVPSLIAVVTGGGSGIGLMIAKALDANGASKVYIVGRRLETLQNAAKQALNGTMIPLQGDCASKESLQSIVQRVKAEAGFINVLIVNHGAMGPYYESLDRERGFSVEEFVEAAFQRGEMGEFTNTFNVNVSSVYFTALAFLPLLDAANKHRVVDDPARGRRAATSQIIITSSIGAHMRIAPAGYAYSASKAAVTHLAKMMATEFVRWGIRVNVIEPGWYPSEMSEIDEDDDKFKGGIDPKLVPEGRVGTKEDMAGTILFLCGTGGAYCNGLVMVSDGGRMGVMPGTY